MKNFIATALVTTMALVTFVAPASANTNDPLEDFMWEQLILMLDLSLELDLCEIETDQVVCTYPIAEGNSVDREINYSISRPEGTVNLSLNETGLEVSYHLNI